MGIRAIGSLALNLIARTKPFTEGIRGARAQVKGFGTEVKGIGRSLTSFGSILTGVSVGGLGLFIRNQIEALDKLAETSDRLGISTQAFSAWEHYAGKAGVASEELEKILTIMNKNVGMFAQGGGAAAKRLSEMGFQFRELTGLAPEAMFRRIAEQISKLPTHAERSAAAMEIFGKAGVKMLPMIQQGAAGLQRMVEEAQALGIAFSREQIAKVEQFADAMDNLKRIVAGFGQRLVIEIAPSIVETIEGTKLLLSQYDRIMGERKGAPGRFLGSTGAQWAAPWKWLGGRISQGVLGQGFRAVQGGYRTMANDLYGSVSTNQPALPGGAQYRKPFSDAVAQEGIELHRKQLAVLERIAAKEQYDQTPIKILFAD